MKIIKFSKKHVDFYIKTLIKQLFGFRAVLILCAASSSFLMGERSPHRPKDPLQPKITARWANKKKNYSLSSSYLEEYPIFKVFKRQDFLNNLLPDGPISFRNEPNKSVDGKVLNELINGLFVEIRKKKRKYKHFTLLQKKDFNRKKKCGLIVFKFKDYPFVLKVFMETPKTFVNPYGKGFDNMFLFLMGGGTNRHINGLTRIKNLHSVRKKIEAHPEWSKIIDMPRKWHWLPQKNYWIHLTGKNLGTHTKPIEIEIPGVFCIVADAIEGKNISLLDRKKSLMVMDLCNYLDAWIDPHANNFIIEHATKKIVVIDTEHFPTAVGLKKKVKFRNHLQWYYYLACKAVRGLFSRDKRMRRAAQTEPNELALI